MYLFEELWSRLENLKQCWKFTWMVDLDFLIHFLFDLVFAVFNWFVSVFVCLTSHALAIQIFLKMDRIDLAKWVLYTTLNLTLDATCAVEFLSFFSRKELKKLCELDEDAIITQISSAWINLVSVNIRGTNALSRFYHRALCWLNQNRARKCKTHSSHSKNLLINTNQHRCCSTTKPYANWIRVFMMKPSRFCNKHSTKTTTIPIYSSTWLFCVSTWASPLK